MKSIEIRTKTQIKVLLLGYYIITPSLRPSYFSSQKQNGDRGRN